MKQQPCAYDRKSALTSYRVPFKYIENDYMLRSHERGLVTRMYHTLIAPAYLFSLPT